MRKLSTARERHARRTLCEETDPWRESCTQRQLHEGACTKGRPYEEMLHEETAMRGDTEAGRCAFRLVSSRGAHRRAPS